MFKSENSYSFLSDLDLKEAKLILLENTLIKTNLFYQSTAKQFIGHFKENNFSLIGTFLPISIGCVLNGDFVQNEKLEIKITSTLHKGFRLLYKIWLIVLSLLFVVFSIVNFNIESVLILLIGLLFGAIFFKLFLHGIYVIARNSALNNLRKLLIIK